VFFVQEHLIFLNKEVIFKCNALSSLKFWQENRSGSEVINNQLTGFQRLLGTGKLFVPEKSTHTHLYWISKKPYGRIYLEIPGHKGRIVGRHQEYVRGTKGCNFEPDKFLYDPKKYIIVPKFF
jgi:hypothetical protein